jgi:hypothetical protein
MEGQKFCVYNQTRESFLSLGVTLAHPAVESLRGLIEKFAIEADSGLWMKPYRNISRAEGLSPFDLVYLDSNYRVVQEIESFPTSTVISLADEAASALVLPVHTIYSSQTQPGDQLVICVADEMERRLERLSSSFPSSPNAQGIVSSKEKQPDIDAGGGLAPLQTRSTVEETMFQGAETMNSFEPKINKSSSLKTWFQNWLSSDRRRSPRQPLPGLVAYYWTGSTPRAYQIADISSTGLYILTEERWFPGTLVSMTLQRTDSNGKNLDDYITIQTRVVRWGSDGLGLAFIVSNNSESLRDGADKKTLERFLGRLKESGVELRMVMR